MLPPADLYACLGVERFARPDQIQQGFRSSARRFHPDVNPNPQAAEEFKSIVAAYEVLNDPRRKADYDSTLRSAAANIFSARVSYSRRSLLRMREPQIVYALAEVEAQPGVQIPDPPLNLCLVVDRSTSMQGARLEQVKAAARQIVDMLNEQDIFSIVTFSDRAEVVLPAQKVTSKNAVLTRIAGIQAAGGTEILQGIQLGLMELQNNLSPQVASHLFLLTDGRTYGDEDECLLLAHLAETDGIIVSGLGIGDEWNDTFLDRLASKTGGQSHYVSSSSVVTRLLTEQVRGIGHALGRIRFQIICDHGVQLKSVFRVAPEAQSLPTEGDIISVGKLIKGNRISVLLEFVVTATAEPQRAICRLWVIGDILRTGQYGQRLSVDLRLPQTDAPDTAPPNSAILAALDRVTLYRLQERAWAEAEQGNIAKATQRLQALASRLLENGERELAQMALNEAARLTQTRQISSENRKRIKYGTRALIPPPTQ